MNQTLLSTAVAIVLMAMPGPVLSAEDQVLVSREGDRTSLRLTIYQDDLALVDDHRRVAFPRGRFVLEMDHVTRTLRPETLMVRETKTPGRSVVLERTYLSDLLTPKALLDEAVGERVAVIRTHPTTGEELVDEGQLLSTTGGVVVQVGDLIHTQPAGRIAVYEVPARLRPRPAVRLLMDSQRGSQRELSLAYLTSGLSWKADHVAVLAPGGDKLSWETLATLNNQSGLAFPDTAVNLVAGEVHRVHEHRKHAPQHRAAAMMMESASMDVAREELGDYHMYTLPSRTSLVERETKQVPLFHRPEAVYARDYVIRASTALHSWGHTRQQLPVQVELRAQNRENRGLGVPIPGGIVRVYQAGKEGSVQFLGEDRIAHTPIGETFTLRLGNAFDVTAEKVQTAFRRLTVPEGSRQRRFEVGYSITVRNGATEARSVRLIEQIPGEWEIISSSIAQAETTAREAIWNLEVPASGYRVLDFTVRIRQ